MMTERLTRRTMPAGSLIAATGLRTGTTAGASALASSPSPGRSATTFFEDPTLNFQTLFALGSAGYGISEVGEVLAAVDRINVKGASYQVFFDEFLGLGRQLAGQADGVLNGGRRVTARERYLRSAEYYSQALYFVLGTNDPTRARERSVYRRMQSSWDRATQLFSRPFELVEIPYGGPLPLRG